MKKIDIKDLSRQINKEALSNYYSLHNLSDTKKYFKISSEAILRKLLRYYNITKSKEDINNTRIKTAIKKYGSLDKYLEFKNLQASKAQLNKSEQKKKLAEERKVKTNLERYGVKQPSQKSDYKEIRRHNIELKGLTYNEYYNNIKEKVKQTKLEKYGNKNYNNIEKYNKTCLQKYNVPYFCMTPEARKFTNNSKINKYFASLLDSEGIVYKREFIIDRFSYDFKVNSILIELNPFATHNSCWGIRGNSGKDKDYHYNKTLIATNNGYRCIHVWDWDNIHKIVKLLKPRNNVYARNCEIKELNKSLLAPFLDAYHIQGNCNNQNIAYGLFFKDKLIQLMTFGKPRYNNNFEYELLRLCSKDEYNVVGGAQRLFNKFITTYKPSSIVSYCDNSKFNGEVYNNLGFILKDYGKPSLHWYNPKTKKHITDNLLRQLGADKLLGTNYGKGTRNEDILLKNNFVKIYDSGQSTYIYRNNKGEI